MLQRKRILVTGGSGFLGKHVVQKLNGNDISIPRSKQYDLSKESDVIRCLEDYQPEIIIHLAAEVGGIGINQEKPGTFYYKNLMMGAMLMEHSKRKNIEKFVSIGTICSYPKFTEVPFKEEDIWKGYPEETNAPYGLAKKMMIVQSQAYRKEFNFNSICLLPVNLYGPGDNFNLKTSHVIPAIIKKCVRAIQNGDKYIECWGDGTPTREFLYVEDAAEAIIEATKIYNSSEPVNIGSGFEIPIKDLTNMIATETGFTGEIVWNTSKPNGQQRRCLDTQKAKEYFGFKAKTTLEEGIKKTIEWYKSEYLSCASNR